MERLCGLGNRRRIGLAALEHDGFDDVFEQEYRIKWASDTIDTIILYRTYAGARVCGPGYGRSCRSCRLPVKWGFLRSPSDRAQLRRREGVTAVRGQPVAVRPASHVIERATL